MSNQTRTFLTLADLRARREEILKLAEQYGAASVRVFGSVARGEATPGSDVDLLVKFEDWASLYDVSGLKQALEELLGCGVDLVSDSPRMKERLKARIMKDVVAL